MNLLYFLLEFQWSFSGFPPPVLESISLFFFFFLGHSCMEMCAQVALLRGGGEFLEANWVDSASLISGTGSLDVVAL